MFLFSKNIVLTGDGQIFNYTEISGIFEVFRRIIPSFYGLMDPSKFIFAHFGQIRSIVLSELQLLACIIPSGYHDLKIVRFLFC